MNRKILVLVAGAATIALLVGVRGCATDDPLDRLERTEGAEGTEGETFRGSWYFPRGGPYVLGTQCEGRCTLRVGGRVGKVRTSKYGLRFTRLVFEPGVYEVEFVRSGAGRLVWHPPGRRGPLEYVPASSLSPEPPETAHFSSPGVSTLDGAIALAILIILIAVIAFLLNGVFTPARGDERTRWLELISVFAIALAVRLIGLGDAGQTWDEDVNWSAGRNYITNLLALDFANTSWIWNLEHPPLMKYMVGIGAQLSDGYGPARAISAAMMSLACALLVPIAARLNLGRAGIYAGLVAALSPHLVGHGQIVGHESAMALTYLVAITAALSVWPSGARSRLETRLAICGAAVGLAVAARFVNGLVGPLVFAIVVFRAPRGRRLETSWKAALIMPVAAVAVFVLLWPRMWQAPIEHLGEAWRVLKKPHAPEPFLGAMTNKPPPYYFAIYLFATAPIGLLVAGFGGLVWFGTNHRRAAVVALLWILIPSIVMFSPVRQDGIRYVIPTLFVLALAAGAAASAAGRHAERIHHRLGPPLPAAALVVYLAITCMWIRPYFIDYYNEVVGGPDDVAATKRFETAWWGEGLAEALDYLNQHAEPGARVYKRCIGPSHLAWLRGDLWQGETASPRNADWALVYSPSTAECPLGGDFELVHEVSAQGAPLARVYRRRPRAEKE